MKALVFERPNVITLKEVASPKLNDGDLLVKVKACLICGTDIRIYRGKKTKDVRLPSILGHEFAGVVAESQNDGFHEGDPVSVAPVLPCGTCYHCTHGQENICANRRAYGYEFDGALAEYVRVPRDYIKTGNVFRVPEGVSFEEVAMAEPLACCINGQRNSPVKLGDVVVIAGAGPIGLLHTQLAKASGATVIVSEPSPSRRDTALAIGADCGVDPTDEDLATAVKAVSNGVGADVVILAIGIPSLVNVAIDIVRKRGFVNLFAGFSVGDMPPIDVNKIHYKEIHLTGTSASTRKDHELALRLIANKTIDVSKIISHRFPLTEANEAFAMAETGGGIKVGILP
jgi:L-iditol 2-dehydrogenase